MKYILGESTDEIKLAGADEFKDIALQLAGQAKTSIDIFTQNLEPEIYSNPQFEQCIFELAKRNANTCIRILVQDSTKAVQNGHRLIRLSQQLTSSVFIHKPSKKYRDEQSAFLIADKIGVIHQRLSLPMIYNGIANFKTPRPAAELGDFFNTVWEHSSSDVQTRRLFI